MELTDDERMLCAQVASGQPTAPVLSAPLQIRGEIIRRLLLGLPLEAQTPGAASERLPGGVVLSHADILGAIELAHCCGAQGEDAVAPLVLQDCRFVPAAGPERADLDLAHARITRLSLVRCRLARLELEDAWISGDLDLDGLQSPEEGGVCSIHAVGARVGGTLRAAAIQLRRAPQAAVPRQSTLAFALDLQGARVEGSVLMREGARVEGGLQLPVHVGGDVRLDGAHLLAHPGEDALSLQSTSIGGNLLLRAWEAESDVHPFRCEGRVLMYGATVGGTVDLRGAELVPGVGDDVSLNASLMRVGGFLLMGPFGRRIERPANVQGSLRLDSASIERGLHVHVAGRPGTEVTLSGLRSDGSLTLDGLAGPLRADNMRIGEDVHIVCNPMPEQTPGLLLRSSCIEGNVHIDQLAGFADAVGVKIEGSCSIVTASDRLGEFNLNDASIAGNLNCRGAFTDGRLWGAQIRGQLRFDESSSCERLIAEEAHITGAARLVASAAANLRGTRFDGSCSIAATPHPAGLRLDAARLSVGADLQVRGPWRYIDLEGVRLDGTLILDQSERPAPALPPTRAAAESPPLPSGVRLLAAQLGGDAALSVYAAEVQGHALRCNGRLEAFTRQDGGVLFLVDAHIDRDLKLGGPWQRVNLWGAHLQGQFNLAPDFLCDHLVANELQAGSSVFLSARESLEMNGARCEGSISLRATPHPVGAHVYLAGLKVRCNLLLEGPVVSLDLEGLEIGGRLQVRQIATTPTPEATPGLVSLLNARVEGETHLQLASQQVNATGLRCRGNCIVEHDAILPGVLNLANATLERNLGLSGLWETVQLNGARIQGRLTAAHDFEVKALQANELQVAGRTTLSVLERLDLTGASCTDSLTIVTPTREGQGLEVAADTLSVERDLTLQGRIGQLTLNRARVGGKLDMEHSEMWRLHASGIRVEGVTILPTDVMGRLKLRSGKFLSGLMLGHDSGMRLHARKTSAGISVGTVDLEDAEISGDLRLKDISRVPANGVHVEEQRPAQWLADTDRLRVYARPLACYEHAHLIEVHASVSLDSASPPTPPDTPTASRRFRAAAFIGSLDGQVISHLNGDSTALYSAAARAGRRLEAPDQVSDYLRMFCAFLWADNVPFVIVEQAADAPWLAPLLEKRRNDGKPLTLQPLAPQWSGRQWKVTTNMVYRAGLYAVTLSVDANSGFVTMEDDSLLESLDGLPVTVERPFWCYEADVGETAAFLIPGSWQALDGQARLSWINTIRDALTTRESSVSQEATGEAIIDLRGTCCDTLDDNDGAAWGPKVFGNLQGFSYGDLGHSVHGPAQAMTSHEASFGRQLASRRIAWLARITAPNEAGVFSPSPYEQLVSVLNRRGDNEAARGVMLERMRLETRMQGRWTRFWRRAGLDIPFQYGLFSRHAICTVLAWLALGTWAFDYANYQTLRWLPVGSMALSPAVQRAPLLVVDATVVNALAAPENGHDVPVMPRLGAGAPTLSTLACGDQVESVLYAMDVMLPILELKQEDKCSITGDASAFGWRLFKGLYAVIGAYIVSMTILTVSGVLRRSIER